MDYFKLPAGSVVHIKGLPFRLASETTFEGETGNIEIATEPTKREELDKSDAAKGKE